MRAVPLAALLVVFLALPAASAWRVAPALPALPGAPLAGPASSPAAGLQEAAACALGDVDADGSIDLLVRTADAAGHVRIEALAGPDFQEAIWSRAAAAQAILQCAADLDADGLADSVLRIASQAAAEPLPAGQAQAQVLLQTVSGATGAVAVARSITESATGAAQEGVAAARQVAQGTLLPAASGALAEVTTKATAVTGLVPELPALGAQAAASATLKLVDAAGRVAGTVTIDGPGVQPLDLAPIPGAGLPQVAALSARAVAQASAGAQVPTLSLHNPDGSLAWAVDLAATTGVPSLVPRIGDLDLDGIPDLLVQTVTGSVSGVPAAAFTAVSGLDGRVLFATAEAAGTVAALPLGAVGEGTAILQAAQESAEGAIQLSALDGAGNVLWTAEAAAGSVAANLALDAFTGDAVGFTDLTGDGLPDVGTAVRDAGGVALTVLDGATGKVAWAAHAAGAGQVFALAQGAAAAATPQLAAIAGQAADLVAVQAEGALNVSVLRGLDGQVEWSATAPLPAGLGLLGVQSAGDIDADGRADLLLTVGPVSAAAGADASGATDALAGAQSYVLSSATGSTLAALGAAGDAAALLGFVLEEGPAYSRPVTAEPGEEAQASPGAAVAVLAVAVVAAALVRRRR